MNAQEAADKITAHRFNEQTRAFEICQKRILDAIMNNETYTSCSPIIRQEDINKLKNQGYKIQYYFQNGKSANGYKSPGLIFVEWDHLIPKEQNSIERC